MGFDWLTVEMEHTPTTIEVAGASFAVIANAGVVPLVRILWNSGENIKRVLDIGAWGIVVPMVNSRAEAEAVVEAARAEDIFSVPCLDAVFIGPNDLHASMGLPPMFDSTNQQFTDAVEHIRVTAQKHGVASGIHVVDPAQARRRVKEGFQFIAVASDAGFMMAKAKEVRNALNSGAS